MEQKTRFRIAAFPAFDPFKTEIDEFIDYRRFTIGIPAPVNAVFLCKPLLIPFAKLSAVIEQDLNLKSAVNPQTAIKKRFEFALVDLNITRLNDLDRKPVGSRQNRGGLAVAGLNRRAQEVADPENIGLGADPPVFTEHPDPASGASGNHFHVFQRQRNSFDNDRRAQNASASGVFDQQGGFRMVLVNHHFLFHAEKTLKINQTMKKLRGLFRIQRKFGPVLLGIDRKITDHLTVLLRK